MGPRTVEDLNEDFEREVMKITKKASEDIGEAADRYLAAKAQIVFSGLLPQLAPSATKVATKKPVVVQPTPLAASQKVRQRRRRKSTVKTFARMRRMSVEKFFTADNLNKLGVRLKGLKNAESIMTNLTTFVAELKKQGLTTVDGFAAASMKTIKIIGDDTAKVVMRALDKIGIRPLE